MTDLERLLAEALRESGENYEPSDQAEARRRFLERARRRRWYGFAQVAAVAGVGIAAFLFFTSQSGTEETVEPQPEQVAGAPEIVATVEIGGDPVSIDAADGSAVWVAGDGRIVSVDPITNEAGAVMTDRPADEVAVGDDSVWIARDGLTGYIDRVDLSTGENPIVDNVRTLDGDGNSITWDIATKGHSLLAVDGVTGNLYSFGDSTRPDRTFRDFTWSDIAIDNGRVWVLDEDQGRVFRPTPADPGDGINFFNIDPGENSDLAAGLGYVWVSSVDGTLRRLSPGGGAEEELRLGDSYMDLTLDEKSVWALVNVDDEHKQLFEIDPGTMEVIGEPLEIDGDANDVVAAAGSVWVADGRGEVLRIEPSREADDAPPPAEDDGTEVEPSPAPSADEIVFVYSANGDIYGETIGGDVVLLNPPSGDIEQHPSFAPDGESILFERVDSERYDDEDGGSDDPYIVQMDLETREEEIIGHGRWPALASDGRLASVTSSAEIDDVATASITISKGSGDALEAEVNMLGTPELPNISHLSWSPDGESLVYQAAGEGTVIKQSEVDGIELTGSGYTLVPTEDVGGFNESSDFQEGSNLVSPHATSNGVLVLRLCCRGTEGDPFEEEMNIGRVRQDIEGVSYEDIGVAGGKPGIEATFETQFVPAGRLVLKSGDGHTWNPSGQEPSWFIFDQDSLWLNRLGGITQYISGQDTTAPAPGHESDTDFRGLAVHPSLLEAEEN